ncbi:cell wall protein [Streptomyces sp. NBC_01589]|uniref:cell wall protein n=1 Tax=unclassified Streptomyces TaxID=2593676 RepID=UPI003869156E
MSRTSRPSPEDSRALGRRRTRRGHHRGRVRARPPRRPDEALDPAIANSAFDEGRITGITGSLLQVAGSYGDRYRIQLTNATTVWKVRPTTVDVSETGDGMYARGVPMPDGTIAADAVWVNIVNLFCTNRGIGKDRLDVAHGNHPLHGRIVEGTTAASYQGSALTSDLSRRIGQAAQILGAWRPHDDSVDIARVTAGH